MQTCIFTNAGDFYPASTLVELLDQEFLYLHAVGKHDFLFVRMIFLRD
jgi:hypothetical protein